MPRRSTSPTRINLAGGYWLDCRETSHPGLWYVYWREADGQRRKSSTGETRRAAAEDYFHQHFLPLQQRVLAAAQPRKGDPIWDDLLDWYEAEKRREGVSLATFDVTRKLRRAVTGRHVSETDGEFWEDYKTHRRAGRYSEFAANRTRADWRHGCKAADGTLLRELRGALAVLRLGIKRHKVSPGLLPPIDLPASPKPRDVFLVPTEMRRMLDYALTASPPEGSGKLRRVALFAALALCTAGRARAVEQLTWDRVDFANGVINLQPEGRRITSKRNATVALLPELRPMLERAWREQKDAPSPHVLRHAGTTRNEWDKFCLAAVGRKVRRHDLRHSLATKMINDGVSLGGVADTLGNTEAMVARVYSHHDKAARAKREVLAKWKPL